MAAFWRLIGRIWEKTPLLNKLKDPWERFTAVAAFLFLVAQCLDYFAAADVPSWIRGAMKAVSAAFGAVAVWLPVREVRLEAKRHRQAEKKAEDRNNELESQIEKKALMLVHSLLADSFIPICIHIHFISSLSPEQRAGYENGLKHRIVATAHALAGKDHYRTSFFEYSNAGAYAVLECNEVSYGRTPSPKPIKGNTNFGSGVVRNLEVGGPYVLWQNKASRDFAGMVIHPVAAGTRIFGMLAIDTQNADSTLSLEHHGLWLSVLAEWLSMGILLCREAPPPANVSVQGLG